ncbi:MAG: hypothetical protein IJ193_01240 [Bacilli bacterium]|nr:hypothetical protein [Bacilli bacterium]
MESKKNASTIIIILLVIIIVILGGLLFLKKDVIFTSTTNTDEVTKSKNGENSKEDSKAYSLTDAEEILTTMGLSVNSKMHTSIGVYPYKNGYTKDYKLANAFVNVDKKNLPEKTCEELYEGKAILEYDRYKTGAGVCEKGTTSKILKYSELNEIYKKMYDEDAPKGAFVFADYLAYIFYDYNSEGNFYNSTSCGGCGGTTGPHIELYKIMEANQKDDTLEITVAYDSKSADTVGTDHEIVYYYAGETYYQKEIKEDQIEKDILEKHIDEVPKYKATFEKSGNNYVFKNLIQVLS